MQERVARAANRPRMHNRALHDTLAAFVEEAASQLAEEVSGGAEVPFELMRPGRERRVPLLLPAADRPLHRRAHGVLARLPSYPRRRRGWRALPDLHAYLQARGRRAPGGDPRALADAALQAFLSAMWAEATDFTFDPERFGAAFRELEEAVYSGCALSVVVTPVDGLVIESDEVALGDGLALVRGVTCARRRASCAATRTRPSSCSRRGRAGRGPGLERAGRRLRRLQTALRLWDDAEPALGPAAWARTDGGAGLSHPARDGLRRSEGDCLVGEEEDPLRAFCALVPPHAACRGARVGAAALRARLRARRRAGGADGLAARRPGAARRAGALGYERLCERLAAICAMPRGPRGARRSPEPPWRSSAG